MASSPLYASPSPLYSSSSPVYASSSSNENDGNIVADNTGLCFASHPLADEYHLHHKFVTPGEIAFRDTLLPIIEGDSASKIPYEPLANAVFWAFVNIRVTYKKEPFSSSFRVMGAHLAACDPTLNWYEQTWQNAYLEHYGHCSKELEPEYTLIMREIFEAAGFVFTPYEPYRKEDNVVAVAEPVHVDA